jgi:diguanylate cyclase (GGDEF)-like protein
LYDIKVLDPAPLPKKPVTPDVARDTALGAVLGFLLGIGLSFLAEYLQKPTALFESMTIVDLDTGLYNRWYFMQRLREELSRLRRGPHGLAVCMINVHYQDNLEQLAPQQMREVLYSQVFLYIKRQMRQGEILTYWDKERLAWLMLDVTEDVVQKAIHRMQTVMSQATFKDESSGGRLNFQFSYGVALAPQAYTGDERAMMSLADQALTKAERSGPAGVYILTSEQAESQPAAQPKQPQQAR